MSSYPLATLAPSIDATGILAVSYDDILKSLIASMQSIYGSDIYLEPDGQDYQLLSVFARAIYDCGQVAVQIYNGFRPQYAQGIGLDSLLKINGIQRQAATNSTAIVSIGGVAGTVIRSGVVKDTNSELWDLPAQVTIPVGGTVDVTATAKNPGAIAAAAGTINQIYTPQLGWQTVTNASAAVSGEDMETDAQLRRRQAASTSLPAQTPLEAIHAALTNLTGVVRAFVYENDTNSTDGNNIPAHSISVVVQGGDVTEIATVIEEKKAPGTGTYGSTTINVTDPMGLTVPINFYELTEVNIYISLTISARGDYVASTGNTLIEALVNFINDNLDVGEDVYYNWLMGVAGLSGDPLGLTYNVTELFIGTAPAPSGTVDIIIPFNKAAICVAANIVLTVI